MMSLMLERFDGAEADLPPGPVGALPGALSGTMDDPPVRPPQETGDPNAERAAAQAEEARLRDELATQAETLARLTGTLQEEAQSLCRMTVNRAAEAIGAVAAELLPCLIDGATQIELAHAAADLAGRLETEPLTLAVAPDDHELVAGYLAALGRDASVTVLNDPGLAPGTARLRWVEGGADFDRDKVARLAARMIGERIDALRPRTDG